MSQKATTWAVTVRGISCAEARVLWHLSDCHNPVLGCFPSQEYLAEACEIDERSVRRHLAALRDKGLVNWAEQRNGKFRENNRYALAFEPGFEPASPEDQPDNLSGSNPEASTGQNQQFEPDKIDVLNRTLVSSKEKPVIEPVKEPVERDAREASEEDDPKKTERAFWRTIKGWPGFDGMPKEAAKRDWFALTADERDRAERRRDAWLARLKAQGKSHTPAPSTYFREKLFDDIAADTADAIAISAPPSRYGAFSKEWFALLLAEVSKPMATQWPALTLYQRGAVAKGGDAARAVEIERRAKYGWPKAAAMAIDPRPAFLTPDIAALSSEFVSVSRGSALFDRWHEMFDRMGWPWPKTEWKWFHLPPGEPQDAMAEFQKRLEEGKGDDDAA